MKIERLNEKSQKTDISYLNYISKENAELIIEKANKDRISLELLYISYKNNQIELKELSSINKFYYAHCLKSIGEETSSNIYLKNCF